MSFLVENEKLLKKYTEIWGEIKKAIGKKIQ